MDRNHIKQLVLARCFDLTAIGFGNYRSPQSIGSLEGADGEPFVVPSAVSIGWHGAIYGRGLPVRATRLCVKPDGGWGSGVLNRMALGLPIAIMADVHYMREAAMRLVARLTICFVPILAIAAQTDAQAPSDPQAYCVNHSADFYPYTGEPCKSGYQLGLGNCRKTDGRMVAVPREQCDAMAGTVEVPFEGGRRPFDGPQAPKSMK